MTTIQVRGDKALRRKISPARHKAAQRRGVAATAAKLKRFMAAYPAVRRGPLPGFPRSDKQLRKVMAMIREGEIPYRRGSSSSSEGLGRKWTVSLRRGGMSAIVGNNASYARLVQSEEDQAAYHRITGWQTDEEGVQDAQSYADEFMRRETDRVLNS